MLKSRNIDPRLAGQRQADQLLEKLSIQSIPIPLEKIASSLGAKVISAPLHAELSGMVFIKVDTPIIGVNSLHHPNRQRFTIAHEIGHLVMHQDFIRNEVHVDKKLTVLMRDAASATGTDRLEIEANSFAAALLMPVEILEKELKKVEFDIDDPGPLEALAKRFRVSRQTLGYRISNMRSSI